MDYAVEQVIEEIVAACESMAGLPYDGEPVDQLQHALQCARLARESGAERDLVVAALLHDIARAPAVASVRYDGDREHHGEIEAFEASSDWRLAIALRRFDDLGKVPNAAVPGLDAYSDDLRAAARERAGGTVR